MSTEQAPNETTSVENEPVGLKPLTPVQRRRLQACYDHASKLMEQDTYDFDYATTLLISCVVGDPGNTVYLENFFANVQSKYQNKKKKAKSVGFGTKSSIKRLSAKEDFSGALRAGLEGLSNNPWDVPTLRALANICAELHAHDTELRYLKNALESKPKDIAVCRHCARSLSRVGQFDMAISCWHRVEAIIENDAEAAREIARLTLERARGTAGFVNVGGDAAERDVPELQQYGHTRKRLIDEVREEQTNAAPGSEKIGLTARQTLEQKILEFPDAVENYYQLAELLADEDRMGEAEQVMNRALSVSGGNIHVREQLEDLQMRRARHQVAIAEQRAAEENTGEANTLAKQMRADSLQREIEIYHRRCERYPEDAALKFELGVRLKRVAKYQEALAALQESLSNNSRKAASHLEIGECHQHLKQYREALESYDASLAAGAVADSRVRLMALYRAGVLSSGLKDLDKATKYLQELARTDPDFKDVQGRLDKLQQIRNKG